MCAGKSIIYFLLCLTVLLPGIAVAGEQNGTLKLENGAQMTWSLTEEEVKPALGIALPATLEWKNNAPDFPVKIDLSTNYAAFIEQWELSLYRESDTRRKHPIRQWRRPAAAFDAGVIWDGEIEAGPPLRPGETVVALLRVRDVAGNVDEAEPQTMLIARYLMSRQRKSYDAETRARRLAVASGAVPAKQTIPVAGQLLTVTIKDMPENSTQMHISGLAMDRTGKTRWRMKQVMPPGSYDLKAQTSRTILKGVKLFPVGNFKVDVPDGDDFYVTVKGTGRLKRAPLYETSPGLKRDGLISGNQAVRLTLWSEEDAHGRKALALADPGAQVALYKNERNRSILRVNPAPRTVPWGGKQRPRKILEPEKVRLRYPVSVIREEPVIALPHTDVVDDRFFVSLRSAQTSSEYLKRGVDYDLNPSQGYLALTDAGRGMITHYNENAGEQTTLEVAYMVHSSLAGMTITRPGYGVTTLDDNGFSGIKRYRGQGFSKPVSDSKSTGSEESNTKSWLQRTFGWLW